MTKVTFWKLNYFNFINIFLSLSLRLIPKLLGILKCVKKSHLRINEINISLNKDFKDMSLKHLHFIVKHVFIINFIIRSGNIINKPHNFRKIGSSSKTFLRTLAFYVIS